MKKKTKALPKPRDPFVLHMIVKKQGAHGKTKKSIRAKDKVALKRSVHDDRKAA